MSDQDPIDGSAPTGIDVTTREASGPVAGQGLVKLAAVAAGLFVFILALELLKKGAGGIAPLFERLSVDGVWDSLGMGWLMAYVVLSGSPVAAIALTLFSSDVISAVQTFAMITGSRLGASGTRV